MWLTYPSMYALTHYTESNHKEFLSRLMAHWWTSLLCFMSIIEDNQLSSDISFLFLSSIMIEFLLYICWSYISWLDYFPSNNFREMQLYHQFQLMRFESKLSWKQLDMHFPGVFLLSTGGKMRWGVRVLMDPQAEAICWRQKRHSPVMECLNLYFYIRNKTISLLEQ